MMMMMMMMMMMKCESCRIAIDGLGLSGCFILFFCFLRFLRMKIGRLGPVESSGSPRGLLWIAFEFFSVVRAGAGCCSADYELRVPK